MKRLVVVGGRECDEWEMVEWFLLNMNPETIITGCARGADSLARRYAKEMEIELVVYKADWDEHGKAAGPIRNKKMIEESNPDGVVAFEPGRGTNNTIGHAKRLGIPVAIVTTEDIINWHIRKDLHNVH